MHIDDISTTCEELFPLMISFRRHLHKHPELSEKEYDTQKYIMDFFNYEGIENKKAAQTGVIATIHGKSKGKTVAIRADIDALPIHERNAEEYCSVNDSVMHACGHDAHTAIAMGCAKFFNDHKNELDGTIKLFFQPAEETVGGAKRMIEEGCMDNPSVDYCIGLHVQPHLGYNNIELKYDALNASTDSFTLTFYGKSGHGASPEQCVDALTIACQAVTMLQSVVSRNISPHEPAILTFGAIEGGKAQNIIADKVQLRGTIRCAAPEVREIMVHRVKSIAQGIADAMGGSALYEPDEGCYIPLINHAPIINIIKECADNVVGIKNISFKNQMSMGGEDFAFFIQNTPGAFYHLGCKLEELGEYGLHTDCFDIDERCLLTGLKMHIAIATRLLTM